MSGTIAEGTGATWDASVADIKNGDDANEATFSPPITVLTRRTKFIFEELFTRGIRKFASYATVAAAKGATTGTVTTGDIVRIAGLGFFSYNSDTAGETELAPLRYIVTGSAGGIWRNVAAGFQSFAIANGLATLDATAKVPSAQLRGHVVASYTVPLPAATLTGTGAFVENAALDLTIPNLAVGDLIVASGGVLLGGSSTASSHFDFQLRLKKTDGSNVLDNAQTPGSQNTLAWGAVSTPASGSTILGMALAGGHVVRSIDLLTPTATSLVVRPAYQGPNASSYSFFQPGVVGLLHIRNPA